MCVRPCRRAGAELAERTCAIAMADKDVPGQRCSGLCKRSDLSRQATTAACIWPLSKTGEVALLPVPSAEHVRFIRTDTYTGQVQNEFGRESS